MSNIAWRAQALAASKDQDTSTAEVQVDPKQAVKDDAAKDADAIKAAFETKGVQEAWDTLKKERLSAKSLSAEDQDVWEKSVSQQITNSTNKLLLPSLSIAYLNENKDALINSNGYIKKAEVNHKKDMINLTLQMEKGGCAGSADDVEGLLLNGASDSIAKGIFNPINAINEMQRGLFSHKQNDEEAVKASRLDDAMDMMSAFAKQEAGFVQNRDFNKSIADRLAGNDKLFALIDEHNKDNKSDGKITVSDVDSFLAHAKKSPYYKGQFNADELKLAEDLQKSLNDVNTYKDKNGTFVNRHGDLTEDGLRLLKSGMFGDKMLPGVTKETLLKSKSAELPKTEVKTEEKTEVKDESSEENKEAVKDEKKEIKDETNVEKKDEESVEHKDETKKVKADNKDKGKTEEITELSKNGIVDENKLVEVGVQKAGEGPYQVAARLLRGRQDAKAQAILTQIFKDQLVEDTQSKDYREAITKFDVGHNFLTCETLEKIREKVGASGNPTLIELFGKSQKELAAQDLKNEMENKKDK